MITTDNIYCLLADSFIYLRVGVLPILMKHSILILLSLETACAVSLQYGNYFYLPGNYTSDSCPQKACPNDCDIGMYRFGCGNATVGACTNCTNKPGNSTYITNGNITNTCSWQCNTNFNNSNGQCLPGNCSTPPLPANAYYSYWSLSSCGYACNAGFFLSGGSCTQCTGSGSYCPPGSTSSQQCPAGSFCPTPSNITACQSGAYCPIGSTSSNQCPAGSFCPTPSIITPCQLGSYCPIGSTSSTPCPDTFYCPTPSAKMPCQPCTTPGMYNSGCSGGTQNGTCTYCS